MRRRRGRARLAPVALVVASAVVAGACTDRGASPAAPAGSPAPAAAAGTSLPASASAPVVSSSPATPPPLATDEPATTTAAPPGGRVATITRTEHGVAHVVADDWRGLGYGQGWAFAEDRACTLIDQVVKVRGERSRWFGPGADDAHLRADLAYRHLRVHAGADERFAGQPEHVVELVGGYVAGFNAQLAAHGPRGWCADDRWFQPITTTDLYAVVTDVALRASSGTLLDEIADAQPPAATASADAADAADVEDAADGAAPTLVPERPPGGGGAGWAIGSALSTSGAGLLAASVATPWEGEQRLWEVHLTLSTGELDVYGATLAGVPGVLLGFNEDVAWTLTPAAGHRMTVDELALAGGDPSAVVRDGGVERMRSHEVTVDVLQADGTTRAVARTMWSTVDGPLLGGTFPWSATRAYALRDANLANGDVLAQLTAMATARDLDAFVDAHRRFGAIPWMSTVATSRDGRAWYGATAVTPHLTADATDRWQASEHARGVPVLDGADPASGWVDHADAPRAGILPFDLLPTAERDDLLLSTGGSHWLASPMAPIVGASPISGDEARPITGRHRMHAALLTDPAARGADGTFTRAELAQALTSRRSVHAELLRDAVVSTCTRTRLVLVDEVPYDIAPACEVLRTWDLLDGTGSRGALLWREYMAQFTEEERTASGRLHRIAFDPDDPIGTPRDFDDDVDQVVLTPLGISMKRLLHAGFALDAPLGEVQFDGRAGVAEPLPIPGGSEVTGSLTVAACCGRPTSMAPVGDPGVPLGELTASSRGVPVTAGDALVLVVELGPDGPHADAVLAYGQPDDPASPWFTSQTELVTRGELRPVRFRAADVREHAVGEPVELTVP